MPNTSVDMPSPELSGSLVLNCVLDWEAYEPTLRSDSAGAFDVSVRLILAITPNGLRASVPRLTSPAAIGVSSIDARSAAVVAAQNCCNCKEP
jgi:hypothetical protein